MLAVLIAGERVTQSALRSQPPARGDDPQREMSPAPAGIRRPAGGHPKRPDHPEFCEEELVPPVEEFGGGATFRLTDLQGHLHRDV